MPEPVDEDRGVAEKDAQQTAAWERTPSPSETGGIPPFIASSTGSFAPVTSEEHVEQTGAAPAASVVPVGDVDEVASPEPVVIEADGDFSPEPDAAGVAADFSPEPIEQSAPAVVPAVIEDDRTVAPAPARTVTDDITVLPVAATPANTSSEQATAQFPSLTQLENGQNTDEGPLVETDHSGLRTMVDDDADATMPIKQKEPRPAPAVIDDPNWGKSSYRPTAARVVRASAASTAAIPVADVNVSPTSVSPDVARDVAPADVVTPAAAGSPSRRASLFDLPDPLAATDAALAPSAVRGESEATAPMRRVHVDDASSVDGVAAAGSPAGRGVRSAPMPVRIDDSGVRPVLVPPTGNAKPAGDIEVLRHAPLADEQPKPKRHRGLFGRKKAQQSDSMSEWLGVDEDFNAKESGESIGSWDHFDDDERAPRGGHWKGGAARSAASRTDADADMGDEDLRDAILSMDDEALRSHDIWFVATGASSLGHAGIKEFVEQNRKLLRGAFVINLECVGAGAPTLLTQEGFTTKRRGDRRLISLLSSVAADLHVGFDKMPRAWADTEATPLMRRSLRAVTIMGMGESQLPAFSRTDGDIPENVVESQVADINAIITEAIRRS